MNRKPWDVLAAKRQNARRQPLSRNLLRRLRRVARAVAARKARFG